MQTFSLESGANSIDYLVAKPKYTVTKSAHGLTRQFTHANGQVYREYNSHGWLMGLPVVSVVRGISPETGRQGVARGFLAIGQRAHGFFAIGRFARGYFSFGQFARARLIAVGQVALAPVAIGQYAIGLATVAQVAAGIAAVGQVGAAGVGVFQAGVVLWGGIGMAIYKLPSMLASMMW